MKKLTFYFAHPSKYIDEGIKLENKLETELNINLLNPFTDLGTSAVIETVKRDIEEVVNSNGIVCYYPEHDSGCMAEMTVGKLNGKPIFILTNTQMMKDIWLQWIAFAICDTYKKLTQSLRKYLHSHQK